MSTTELQQVLWGHESYREIIEVDGKEYVNYTPFGEYLLIEAAKNGDSLAIRSLAEQYSPLLSRLRYTTYRGLTIEMSDDDFDSATWEAVYETAQNVVQEYGERAAFGGLLSKRLKYTLLGRQDQPGFTVPQRTFTRFRAVLKKAVEAARGLGIEEGSDEFSEAVVDEAHEICELNSMRPETFDAIYSQIEVLSLESLDIRLSGQVEIDLSSENEDMVRAVFDRSNPTETRLTNRERSVLKYRYGLDYSYDDLDDYIIDDTANLRTRDDNTDSAVGYALGVSRPAVQKAKQNGLKKARLRLEVK